TIHYCQQSENRVRRRVLPRTRLLRGYREAHRVFRAHGRPDGTTQILEVAARHGYHAVGLMWPTYFAAIYCKADDSCYTDFREALFRARACSRHVRWTRDFHESSRHDREPRDAAARLREQDRSWEYMLGVDRR